MSEEGAHAVESEAVTVFADDRGAAEAMGRQLDSAALIAQEGPGVDEQEANAQPQEPQGRIVRGCSRANLAQATVTGLDTKAPAVLGLNLMGWPLRTSSRRSCNWSSIALSLRTPELSSGTSSYRAR